MDELIYAPATMLVQRIMTKQVSAVEVLEAYLSRIAAVNSQLNAVVQIPEAQARAAAQVADDVLAAGGETGPLHGVPFTVKDIFATASVISAAGLPERAEFMPPHDAVAVARLRAAGAILLG